MNLCFMYYNKIQLNKIVVHLMHGNQFFETAKIRISKGAKYKRV